MEWLLYGTCVVVAVLGMAWAISEIQIKVWLRGIEKFLLNKSDKLKQNGKEKEN